MKLPLTLISDGFSIAGASQVCCKNNKFAEKIVILFTYEQLRIKRLVVLP